MINISKKVLKDYRKAKLRASILASELDQMEQDGNMIAGTIIDYSKGSESIEAVMGFDWERYGRLSDDLAKENDVIESVELFVDQIQEAEIRAVFKMRYIDGLSWLLIANKIGNGIWSEDYVRHGIHDKYMKKNKIPKI